MRPSTPSRSSSTPDLTSASRSSASPSGSRLELLPRRPRSARKSGPEARMTTAPQRRACRGLERKEEATTLPGSGRARWPRREAAAFSGPIWLQDLVVVRRDHPGEARAGSGPGRTTRIADTSWIVDGLRGGFGRQRRPSASSWGPARGCCRIRAPRPRRAGRQGQSRAGRVFII